MTLKKTATLPPALAARLQEAVGARLSTGTSVLDQHARGEGWDRPVRPAAVCYPHTAQEIATILAACNEHRVPVVPFGAGSSLEGHVVPLYGGISLDLRQMDAILEVNDQDLDCRVQAGVTRKQLDKQLRFRGLFFPVDPGADATLGGMVATGASGTTTVRYGAMGTNVLGLSVVLANGSIIRTGSRARKSAAGYDLTRLFIGSEGTLGVITEVQLRLYGIPEAISAAVCQFDDLGDAVDTVIESIQLGIPVARCELLDEVQMGACIRHSGLTGYRASPTLFFEFHGTATAVQEHARQVGDLCKSHGGSEFEWATRTEDRSRLWRARHDAFFAALALAPGKRGLTSDACVPLSRLAECIRETQRDLAESALLAPIVGHLGDGNFHAVMLCDPDDPDEVARAKAVNTRLAERARTMGGTCTGEHGVGSGKIEFIAAEHGAGIEVMRAIKQALDPNGIMNPGKVFRAMPDEPGTLS